ncbi:MAG: thioesterase [Clostridia bacterium]|nr:thioesterase [Clostridia bacterium]
MSTTLKARIESYDVTPKGLMRQSTIFRLCQRAAGDDLDKVGGSFETLVSHGLTFVITKMEITYFADIKTYDEIEIITYPRGVKGPSFIRDYDILKNGERVAYASSHWVLIDIEKRKFCRPSSLSSVCEIIPDMDNLYEMEMRKIHPDLSEMEKADERKVYYSNIDRNNHMNNTFYPDILFDYLPDSYLDTLKGKTITVQYSSEILCGEHFTVYKKEEDGAFILSARCEKEDKDIFSAMITM